MLRRLFTEPVLTYRGEYHSITEAGLNPMPIQQPIPIWIGGTSEIPLKRAGRLADGWFPIGVLDDKQRARIVLLDCSSGWPRW